MSNRVRNVLASAFPEIGAGGFSRRDGSVEFYGRISALVHPEMRVLDFGAGRAQWYEDDRCEYRRQLRNLQGRVRELIACDVDPVVHKNRAADRSIQIDPQAPLPFDDGHFDLIVADYVFEHVDDPRHVSRELARVLKTGGWICARTPNKYGYVAIGSRLISNRFHTAVLARLQPHRKAMDVFPTRYKLNTFRSLRAHFKADAFDDFSYRYDPEPAYYMDNEWVLKGLSLLQALMPPQLSSQLLIFLRKR